MLAYLLIKNENWRKRLKVSFLIIFFFFSYKPIALLFISGWETEGQKLEEIEYHEVGVVLGGGFEYDNDRDRLSIRRGGDRIWCAIQLFNMKKLDYLLLSGKNGDLTDMGLDESNQLKQILITNGIPEDRILVDSESQNTYQNAVYSKSILDSMGAESVLLITSALHMRRAEAVFSNQGIECEVFPTDFYSGGYQWQQFLFLSLDSFHLWSKYFHEVFGYIVYAVSGKL